MANYKVKFIQKYYTIGEAFVLGDDEFDARLVAETRYESGDLEIKWLEDEEGELFIDEVEEVAT